MHVIDAPSTYEISFFMAFDSDLALLNLGQSLEAVLPRMAINHWDYTTMLFFPRDHRRKCLNRNSM